MRHSEESLKGLWDRVKNERNHFSGKYTGLKAVRFYIAPEDFAADYDKKVNESFPGSETKVFTSIDEAIAELKDSRIFFHHLSCAADTGIGNNSALCIHYRKGESEKNRSLAILGVNYIPDEKTRNYLTRVLKERIF